MWRYFICSLVSDWTPTEIDRWEAIFRKGKARYLIKHGVLYWGGWLFLVLTAALLYYEKEAGTVITLYDVAELVFFNLLACVIAGWVWGIVLGRDQTVLFGSQVEALTLRKDGKYCCNS